MNNSSQSRWRQRVFQTIFAFDWGVWLVVMFLLFFFYARNPYSPTFVISNFEPFPDSFYYTVPALQVVKHGVYGLQRMGGAVLPTAVPPLYPMFLVVGYAFYPDPRTYYLVNVVILFICCVGLYKIGQEFQWSRKIHALVMIFFLTHGALQWYVQFAMAEVVLLALTIWIMAVFLQKSSPRSSVTMSGLLVALYAAKYAAAVILVIFSIGYFVKLASEWWSATAQEKPKARITLLWFIGGYALATLVLSGVQWYTNGPIPIIAAFKIPLKAFQTLLEQFGVIEAGPLAGINAGRPLFGTRYFLLHFSQYMQSLVGIPVRFLWRPERIWTLWITFPALIGIVYGMFVSDKKIKYLFATASATILGQILFMSLFYSLDSRYIIHIVPIGIIFAATGLQTFELWAKKRQVSVLADLIVLTFALWFVAAHAKEWRGWYREIHQVPGVAWHHYVVKRTNELVTTNENEKTAIVLTSLAPFLWDYYKDSHYNVFPLTNYIDFYNDRAHVLWGNEPYYPDVLTRNIKLAQDGVPLYLVDYGRGYIRIQERNNEVERYKEYFTMELLEEGCHGVCRFYRLHLIQ